MCNAKSSYPSEECSNGICKCKSNDEILPVYVTKEAKLSHLTHTFICNNSSITYLQVSFSKVRIWTIAPNATFSGLTTMLMFEFRCYLGTLALYEINDKFWSSGKKFPWQQRSTLIRNEIEYFKKLIFVNRSIALVPKLQILAPMW